MSLSPKGHLHTRLDYPPRIMQERLARLVGTYGGNRVTQPQQPLVGISENANLSLVVPWIQSPRIHKLVERDAGASKAGKDSGEAARHRLWIHAGAVDRGENPKGGYSNFNVGLNLGNGPVRHQAVVGLKV
ncbi:hypothetical protein FOPE_07724 [Fonsecaea pedrosoi]|nr:hypothetical protein FOPE_07724 [Fonsecaea pedrosoi]